ncbi:hypothetical protein [uncultured Nonlabens sp.]|uniref:hypothetical protein n=1 Tax=uncultured Nonlabens sp. TaxID=859306 RepID=UPI00260A554A|nr:hypothetical protein [uncultured Nonlabens sp.]
MLDLSLIPSQKLLVSSTQNILGLFLIASILTVFLLWFLKCLRSENGNAGKNSISIKIDRNGKYRYETVPNSGNSNLKFWIKIMIAIIAVAFLWSPIKSIINPQY